MTTQPESTPFSTETLLEKGKMVFDKTPDLFHEDFFWETIRGIHQNELLMLRLEKPDDVLSCMDRSIIRAITFAIGSTVCILEPKSDDYTVNDIFRVGTTILAEINSHVLDDEIGKIILGAFEAGCAAYVIHHIGEPDVKPAGFKSGFKYALRMVFGIMVTIAEQEKPPMSDDEELWASRNPQTE